ncbi:MAG: DNA repair ATPase [Pirellulaceae bacterium]
MQKSSATSPRQLRGTAHVTTDHNCIPRLVLSIGKRLLLGYNVQFGLKTGIQCEDVFSMYRLEGEVALPQSLDELAGDAFHRDFQELYHTIKALPFLRLSFGRGRWSTLSSGLASRRVISKPSNGPLKGPLQHIDARSDADVRYPAQHAFHWSRATREQHRAGLHPHISINDTVFVECVGGDLTIKVEQYGRRKRDLC